MPTHKIAAAHRIGANLTAGRPLATLQRRSPVRLRTVHFWHSSTLFALHPGRSLRWSPASMSRSKPPPRG